MFPADVSLPKNTVCFLCPYSCLQAVSVDVELRHRLAPDVDVLDLLGGDVLALRQLEDVLLPVDDHQRAVL